MFYCTFCNRSPRNLSRKFCCRDESLYPTRQIARQVLHWAMVLGTCLIFHGHLNPQELFLETEYQLSGNETDKLTVKSPMFSQKIENPSSRAHILHNTSYLVKSRRCRHDKGKEMRGRAGSAKPLGSLSNDDGARRQRERHLKI